MHKIPAITYSRNHTKEDMEPSLIGITTILARANFVVEYV